MTISKGTSTAGSPFAGTGIGNRRKRSSSAEPVDLLPSPVDSVLDRLLDGDFVLTDPPSDVEDVLAARATPAITADLPPLTGMSAGKNTYSYDAHTYHTKVPPQGIAELLRHYLPHGGLVVDPFAGSGMTGVAGSAVGSDVILNELSPAAAFISSRFVSKTEPEAFAGAIRSILDSLADLRRDLYTTTCRECGADAELLYVVWSYRVQCGTCDHDFNIWDACRSYGYTVREHKILTEFPCPGCAETLKKRELSRTHAEPVEVAYMCCGSRQKERTHAPSQSDLDRIKSFADKELLAEGFYPTADLPDGVNLRQPRKHGLTTVDSFYTDRNLIALSHIWRTIHRLPTEQLRGAAAFAFTSLYRRVTRLSEFRFWGGSGNSARLNVPYIFDESNVFRSFERKCSTIQDHLETTARHYSGKVVVRTGSATDMGFLPDNSVDLVFTDPPFGANINYSEVNFLWESWLGRFTDIENEAIVNRVQGKSVSDYERLMKESMSEAYRVLRPGHWMLLVFMNSSATVWSALRNAITSVGFQIESADVFDKQHGTFKQFVSPNTPGADLVLHCRKGSTKFTEGHQKLGELRDQQTKDSIDTFLSERKFDSYRTSFLHVERASEPDIRTLYSEWLAQAMLRNLSPLDFETFRKVCLEKIAASDGPESV